MSVDPATPVIVGVGQVTDRPDTGGERPLSDRPEPIDLMVEAVRAAIEDCDGARPGGTARSGQALVAAAQSLRVANPLSWQYLNPGLRGGRGVGHRAGRARRDHRGRQQPAEHGQCHRAGHRPRRPGRGRGGRRRLRLHPDRGAASSRPAPAALDGAAGRHPPSDRVRHAPPGHHRRRGGAWARPAHPRVPAVRERTAGRGRTHPGRAPPAHRRPLGPLLRGGLGQSPRLAPRGRARPRRSSPRRPTTG